MPSEVPDAAPRHEAAVTSGPVLLYDGQCGLCQALVRSLLRRDRAQRLRFAPLQGRFGQATLRRLRLPTADFHSLVYLPDATGAAYSLRTDGVLAVLRLLGGGWQTMARGAAIVPVKVRDLLYRLVAATRHRLWPAPARRPLPPHAEERILR